MKNSIELSIHPGTVQAIVAHNVQEALLKAPEQFIFQERLEVPAQFADSDCLFDP